MNKIKLFNTTCMDRLETTINVFFNQLKADNSKLLSINIVTKNETFFHNATYEAHILYKVQCGTS